MSLPNALGPGFEPPYDSPIEELFAQNAIKYLAEDCRFEKQTEVPTVCGTYRLDFVAERDGKRVAVECDGREFHDEYRDEWRDALILGAGAVDVIYRFRGCDLVYHVEDLLFLMSDADPHFFSERGRINLRKLASDEVRARGGAELSPGSVVTYRPTPGEYATNNFRFIDVTRWERIVPPNRRALWWDWWRHARAIGSQCRTVAELMDRHQAYLRDLEAGKISGEWECEDCGKTIDRRDVKAVWDQRVICSTCYAEHYRKHVQPNGA